MLEKNNYVSDYFRDIFSEFIISGAFSENTIKAYETRINGITKYLKKDFLAISEHDAELYFEKLYNDSFSRCTKNTSIYARWSACNTLAQYILENHKELSYENPFAQIDRKTPCQEVKYDRIPNIISIDSILSNVDDEMYYLVFSLAFRVALSVHEILTLKVGQIHYTETGCTIALKDKQRVIALPSDIASLMKNYIEHMAYMDEKGHLFYNKYKNPLNHDNLSLKLVKVLERSGIEVKYTLKDLRSRGIMDMLLATAQSEGGSVNVSRYVGLQELRINAYAKSGFVVSDSPAELVKIRVKEFGSDGENGKRSEN